VIPDLLAPLNMAGMLLTLDALHTVRTTAQLITGPLDAHYLLILKGNQPLALRAAQALPQPGPQHLPPRRPRQHRPRPPRPTRPH
jgi:hypothetical protein